MPAPPKPTAWPRAYLLSIYAKAMTEGAIWIEGLTGAEAVSLRQSFYRLRRRSDTSNSSLILPEYHLITMGNYDPARQRMAVIYDRLPDGEHLPTLTSMAPGERFLLPAPTQRPNASPHFDDPANQANALLQIEAPDLAPEDIDAFVARLTANVTDND